MLLYYNIPNYNTRLRAIAGMISSGLAEAFVDRIVQLNAFRASPFLHAVFFLRTTEAMTIDICI